MTRAAGLSSINCTQCGAGLSVLGGGRVLSHVCGYCGAVLDAQDDYRILTSIGKRDHPASPVRIGMTLTVQGVAFTVIGTLGMVETYMNRTWEWVEHQLFSPTHGYAWLTWEDGHFTFTRKIRDYDMRDWLTPATVESADKPPRRAYRGQRFRYYETSTARIDFMEGEFNWVPRLGSETVTISLLGRDAMLGLRQGPHEREVELTRLLDRTRVLADLGLDPAEHPARGFHPLTPYRPLHEEGFLRGVTGISAAAALALGLVFWVMAGHEVLRSPRLAVADLPQSFDFEVSNTEQLARVEFASDVDNSWAVFSAEITGPAGAPVVAGARTTEFYHGVEDGERWTEGSRRAAFFFRPEAAGRHRLTLAMEEAERVGSVTVRVEQGKPVATWLFAAAGAFGLVWALLTGRRAAHFARRFAGSDWSE